MFKTISAALLAVSMIAAPALAADGARVAQPAPVKASVLDANAKMMGHRAHHRHHMHYRHHHKMGAIHAGKTIGVIKTHKKVAAIKSTKLSFKHAATKTKRG
jgi:hypothetical protein